MPPTLYELSLQPHRWSGRSSSTELSGQDNWNECLQVIELTFEKTMGTITPPPYPQVMDQYILPSIKQAIELTAWALLLNLLQLFLPLYTNIKFEYNNLKSYLFVETN